MVLLVYSQSIDKQKFEGITEENVVILAKSGDRKAEEHIIKKYKNFVRAKARSYYLIGADKEDIIQEGMIGLFKAIRDYDTEKAASFKVFAELCITRQMITAIKTATRQKHKPLNSYVSLNKPVFDEESDRTLLDMISGEKITNPEDLMISKEEMNLMELLIEENLSSFEMEVLNFYLQGKTYNDITGLIDKPIKSIDNALQRIKRKLERYIQSTKY